MSTYRFRIRNYHAIQEADLAIDGITVLSGINGCGKSTLSRWLYYLIKGSFEFENNLFKGFAEELVTILHPMLFICNDVELFNRTIHNDSNSATDKLYRIKKRIEQVQEYSKSEVEVVRGLFIQALETSVDCLKQNVDSDLGEARMGRILRYLDTSIENKSFEEAINEYAEKNQELLDHLTDKLYNEINERSYDSFIKELNKRFKVNNDIPSEIQLEEEGVALIDKRISNLYNLQDTIYIDTPMSITSDSTNNYFWKSLRQMIKTENSKQESSEVKKILMRIKMLMGGEAVLDKDDNILMPNTLRYISSDQEVNIELSEAATGFKTFSYLQRLLENGYLNEKTLLLIDEPEAHLHPQWIVEYARLLVLLNKKVGLKIMIASHNPDMVAAIHDIANKEGLIDKTNFYVAKECEGSKHQFVYKPLGHDIKEIFESFNIALDRIQEYGTAGL